MRICNGALQNGIVVGNAFDKYGSRNPLVRRLMDGFEKSLRKLVARSSAKNIHEVGCGEGYWTLRLLKEGYRVRGSDFSTEAIDLARASAQTQRVDLKVASIYELAPPGDAAELIICCEVLEHLEDPERGLQVLRTLASPFLIASVPREPIWRILNLVRGSYWKELGNTPGHLQHWSKQAFVKLIGRHFDVLEVKSPLPWTMILAQQKRRQ
jgi:SAM-dependent methyltransferase